MATALEIPLAVGQPQTLAVSLVGTTYNLTIKWNTIDQLWVLDLYDSNNNLLVGGINMVPGQNLLSPYGYLEIGGQLIIQTDNDPNANPTFDSLGSTTHLYFLTD